MNIKSIHINEVKKYIEKGQVAKKKRERAVYQHENVYYKVWVQNWGQGDIAKHAYDVGYYDTINSSGLISFIYDDVSQRGYVMKAGKSLGNSWHEFNQLTSMKERRILVHSLLTNALKVKGIYTDFHPSNLVRIDEKISLIDLDSYNSFSFLFEKKNENFEKFDPNAWWKPHETISRDTNKFYKEYFKICLGVEIDFNINSVESIQMLISKLNDIQC